MHIKDCQSFKINSVKRLMMWLLDCWSSDTRPSLGAAGNCLWENGSSADGAWARKCYVGFSFFFPFFFGSYVRKHWIPFVDGFLLTHFCSESNLGDAIRYDTLYCPRWEIFSWTPSARSLCLTDESINATWKDNPHVYRGTAMQNTRTYCTLHATHDAPIQIKSNIIREG